MRYLIILLLLPGCADHYWKGRAYEERIKAIYLTPDGKEIPECDDVIRKECIVK